MLRFVLFVVGGKNSGRLFHIKPTNYRKNPARAQGVVEEDLTVLAPLIQELKAGLRTFQKPFYIFHYANVDLEKNSLQSHLEDWSRYYWNRSQDLTSKGYVKGFYAALDPNDLIVTRIEYPTSAAALDLTNRGATAPSMENLKLMSDLGCPVENYVGIFQGNSKNSVCRGIAITALKALGVSAIIYGYTNSPLKDCIEDFNLLNHFAMIIIRPESIPAQNIRNFTASNEELDVDGGTERRVLRLLLQRETQALIRQT